MLLDHLERLKAETTRRYTLANIPDWIVRNTKLKGQPFSFKDHEYQLKILQDPSPEKVIRKPSQVGLSEMTFREVLAVLRIIVGASAIYTMPTATDAEKVCKTRINPIIDGSKDLSFAVSNEVNSTTVKQFGESFLYLGGTFGQTQAISTPADMLVHDEVDFSNLMVLTTYESRTTHSKYKLRREFSTPTLPKRGISASFDRSRRHFNFVKCCDCNEWFLPDYYKHVIVPDWDKPLEEINENNLHLTRWREAHLICPHCGTQPELWPQFREWVCENPTEQHTAAGFAVAPFDAPAMVTVPFLVEKSTKYKRRADFVNFALGLPFEDAKESLTESLLKSLHVTGEAGNFAGYCLGADMGLTCHLLVGLKDSTGQVLVVHFEKCELANFQQRKLELCAQYRILVSVLDAFPYTDTVMQLQHSDQNLFGGVFHSSKNIATFTVTDKPEVPEEGKLAIKQAKINRNLAFDELNGEILRRKVTFLNNPHQEEFISHLLDLKRTQVVNKDGEFENVWVKSEDGRDHFFFALLYLYTAIQLRGTVVPTYPWTLPVSSFRLKNP
jgi:hypothetical protein